MKIGALVSGGKDSLAAAYKASKEHELVCIIAIKSLNPESYMFHIPNINLVNLQAEAMGIPIIFWETEGEKELELEDLADAVAMAKEKYRIQGLVTGAIASNYQRERIERICLQSDLVPINPLWQIHIGTYVNDLLRDFKIIISGIAADGLDESDLGKRFDLSFLEKLKKLKVNMVGEGGEFETFVLKCPLFKKEIQIKSAEKRVENKCTGHYLIKKAVLV